jgi:hypothetical protein
MISFDLKCVSGHVFEAWFPDSAGYDAQRRGGKLCCPVCGGRKVEKALMTPNVARGAQAAHGAQASEGDESIGEPGGEPGGDTDSGAGDDLGADKEATAKTLKMLVKLRQQVEQNCDHVGDKFAEEARKIHHGEVDKRNIYGRATGEEARELKEEGIEFGEIPWLPNLDS